MRRAKIISRSDVLLTRYESFVHTNIHLTFLKTGVGSVKRKVKYVNSGWGRVYFKNRLVVMGQPGGKNAIFMP
jgi:hypothetical protein